MSDRGKFWGRRGRRHRKRTGAVYRLPSAHGFIGVSTTSAAERVALGRMTALLFVTVLVAAIAAVLLGGDGEPARARLGEGPSQERQLPARMDLGVLRNSDGSEAYRLRFENGALVYDKIR